LAAFIKGVQNGQKADVSAIKSDQLAEKAAQIHESTNGALGAALQKIASLEEMVRELKQTVVTTEECRRKHLNDNE